MGIALAALLGGRRARALTAQSFVPKFRDEADPETQPDPELQRREADLARRLQAADQRALLAALMSSVPTKARHHGTPPCNPAV